MAGVGGGTLLVTLAHNLNDTYAIKSWLIILAPSLTFMIKWLWNVGAPEVLFVFQKLNAGRARRDVLAHIDSLLEDPRISEERKRMLRVKREDTRVSVVDEPIEHLAAVRQRRSE
jgi:hypothetical protein